jgi:hypothetical protein
MAEHGNGISYSSLKMAELTYDYCKKHCKILGSCCSPEYCNFASAYARSKGIHLEETGNKIPFLDKNGKCVCPPEYRYLCTVHQCDINALGFFKDDLDGSLTKKYYKIRSKIEKQLGKEMGE